MSEKLSRRNYLKLLGAATVSASTVSRIIGQTTPDDQPNAKMNEPKPVQEDEQTRADRERRMKWWHEARFGMFIHWGLYSVLGRHEWAMEMEGIPATEYRKLAKQFKPKPNAARDWAQLAKATGQKMFVYYESANAPASCVITSFGLDAN